MRAPTRWKIQIHDRARKRHFEGASPVDAALERVLAPPVLKLAEDVIAVGFVASEHGSLGQQDKVLVAVDLPNELVIASGGEVEIRNPAEVRLPAFQCRGAGRDAR